MRLDIYNGTRQEIPKALLQRAADVFGKKMRVAKASVSVAFVGERRMRALNRQYRSRDCVTDVLSFGEGRHSRGYAGEVVICYQQIRRQAKRQKTSVRAELLFIFMHGLLHLSGYDDTTERGWREMERAGTRLCTSIDR